MTGRTRASRRATRGRRSRIRRPVAIVARSRCAAGSRPTTQTCAPSAPSRRRGLLSESRGRAGHDRRLPVELKLFERRPAVKATAGVVAEPGEASDDGRLERTVDETSDAHGLSAVRMPAAALSPVRLKSNCSTGSSSLASTEVERGVVVNAGAGGCGSDRDRVARRETRVVSLEHDAALLRVERCRLVAHRQLSPAEAHDEVEGGIGSDVPEALRLCDARVPFLRVREVGHVREGFVRSEARLDRRGVPRHAADDREADPRAVARRSADPPIRPCRDRRASRSRPGRPAPR